jgi:hypothetical protein
MNELFKNQKTEIRIVEDFFKIRHVCKSGETIGLDISIEDLIKKLAELLKIDKKQ